MSSLAHRASVSISAEGGPDTTAPALPSKAETIAQLKILLEQKQTSFHAQELSAQLSFPSNTIAPLISGIPQDGIAQILGPHSSGKTTLALQLAADLSQKGGHIALIDGTGLFFPPALGTLGADLQRILFIQPPEGTGRARQKLLIWSIEQSLQSGIFSLVLVLLRHVLHQKIQRRFQLSCERSQTALLLIGDSDGPRWPSSRVRLEVQPEPSPTSDQAPIRILAPSRHCLFTSYLRNRPPRSLRAALTPSRAWGRP